MTGPVQPRVSVIHAWIYLPESRDLTKQYHQLSQLSSSILSSAAYQAGCVWSQATVCWPEAQSPANWGWIKHDQVWKICWTTLPHIAASCQELTKYGCKAECHGRCKCYRLGLNCTVLCSCTCQDYSLSCFGSQDLLWPVYPVKYVFVYQLLKTA